jgi:hypothetical protein
VRLQAPSTQYGTAPLDALSHGRRGPAAVWANQGRSRTRNPLAPSVRTGVCVTRNHSRFPGCNVVGCWRKEAVMVSGRHTCCSLQAQALASPIRAAEIRRPTCRLEFRSPDLAGGLDPLPTLTAANRGLGFCFSCCCSFSPQCAHLRFEPRGEPCLSNDQRKDSDVGGVLEGFHHQPKGTNLSVLLSSLVWHRHQRHPNTGHAAPQPPQTAIKVGSPA